MPKEKKPSFNLQSILDSHDNPFVIIDETRTIVEVNRAYCSCYDTSPSEVIGSKCHMVFHKSELPCHTYGEECPMEKVMETGEKYEVSHVHHNREHFPECVSIKGFPITDEDGRRYLGEEISHVTQESDTAVENPIRSIEASYIAKLLVDYHGDRHKVAEILKVSKRTLYRKLASYNLKNVGKNT